MSNISCAQIEPLLSAYRDGELTESERKEADKHINGCGICQNRLIELNAVVAALNSLPRLEPKVDYAANIEQLLASQPKQSKLAVRKPIIWGGVGIAAAAAVMIAIGNLKQVPSVAPSIANLSGVQAPNPGVASIKNERQDHKPTTNESEEISIASADSNSGQRSEIDSPTSKGASNEHLNSGKQDSVDPNRPVNKGGKRTTSKFNPPIEVANVTDSVTGGDTMPLANLGSNNLGSAGSTLSSNSQSSRQVLVGEGNLDSNLVAVYETDQKNVTEELGITTDEDGLYAIKL